MNTGNAAKFNSTVPRNLHRKNVYLWPLGLPSFLGLIMGVLILMTMAAPSAHAVVLSFFDFENGAAAALFPATPYPQDSGTTSPPATLANETFPSGTINIDSTGGNPGGVLDLRGNSTDPNKEYCFVIGPINDTGTPLITLSFDLLSVPQNPNHLDQFTNLALSYGTSAAGASGAGSTAITTFTDLRTHTSSYFTYSVTFTAPQTTTLFVEFCFNGSTDTAHLSKTLVDNIQFSGVIPEPTTVAGGVLAALGLCWYQRRRFTRFLGLRPA